MILFHCIDLLNIDHLLKIFILFVFKIFFFSKMPYTLLPLPLRLAYSSASIIQISFIFFISGYSAKTGIFKIILQFSFHVSIGW